MDFLVKAYFWASDIFSSPYCINFIDSPIIPSVDNKAFLRNMYFILIIFVFHFVQPIFSEECSIRGKCINSEGISGVNVSSVEECIVKCFVAPNCKFSTFNSVSNECIKFKTCIDIDENCMECWTNEKECVDSKKKLLAG